jgi:hypothetical protein
LRQPVTYVHPHAANAAQLQHAFIPSAFMLPAFQTPVASAQMPQVINDMKEDERGL